MPIVHLTMVNLEFAIRVQYFLSLAFSELIECVLRDCRQFGIHLAHSFLEPASAGRQSIALLLAQATTCQAVVQVVIMKAAAAFLVTAEAMDHIQVVLHPPVLFYQICLFQVWLEVL